MNSLHVWGCVDPASCACAGRSDVHLVACIAAPVVFAVAVAAAFVLGGCSSPFTTGPEGSSLLTASDASPEQDAGADTGSQAMAAPEASSVGQDASAEASACPPETDFATDPNNCGSCGHVCPWPASGDAQPYCGQFGAAPGTCIVMAGCTSGGLPCGGTITTGCYCAQTHVCIPIGQACP